MSTQPEQSPEHIEEQIEGTRRQLNDTVEDIQNKLSPNNIIDETLNYIKTNKEFRRNVTTTIRDNPVPVLLMGISLIWLAASGAAGARRTRVQSTTLPAKQPGAAYPEDPAAGPPYPPGSGPTVSTPASMRDTETTAAPVTGTGTGRTSL